MGIVAIIGRPNVGKSTLFNRLTRSDRSIVDDQPGVTRDRVYGLMRDDDQECILIDTGGFETDDFKFQPFADNLVWKQTLLAIEEADVVLLVVDSHAGINPHDRELKRILDEKNKTTFLVVNKSDGKESTQNPWDFYSLSESPMFISAAHGRGTGDLTELVFAKLKELGTLEPGDRQDKTRVALIGKPNAGKSSILNRLVGEERAVVSDVAGTTRDSVDTQIRFNGKQYILVDTAGMRRKSKIYDRVESMSVVRSIRALERADVVVVVLDASEGLSEQEMRLCDLATKRHKPLLIVVNKWDLVPNKDTKTAFEWQQEIHLQLRSMDHAPILFVSCLENQRVHKIMAKVETLAEMSSRRTETSRVNEALRAMVHDHTPAVIKGLTKRVKFYFATQVSVCPPTFVVFCNVADKLQESYKRYMTRRFQEELGFNEVPIKLLYRSKKEQNEDRNKERELKGMAPDYDGHDGHDKSDDQDFEVHDAHL